MVSAVHRVETRWTFHRPQDPIMQPLNRLALAVAAIASLGASASALAHGTMSKPTSRVYACYQGNPEQPTNPACAAAKDIGGAQPFYDWAGINQANANGNRHYTFEFLASAPHATREWKFYVTRDGWQPGSPLRWADLQEFCTLGDVPLSAGGVYKLDCPLPQ